MCGEARQSAIGVVEGALGQGIDTACRRLAMPIPKKDGAPVPGSPGLQAISFDSSLDGLNAAQRAAKFPCGIGRNATNIGSTLYGLEPA